MAMKKSELEAEVRRLQDLLSSKDYAFSQAVKIGVRTQRHLTKSVALLKSISGLRDHTKWTEIKDFLEDFEIIQHPTYGEMVVVRNETVIFAKSDAW
jgi:fumarate hydratase class II